MMYQNGFPVGYNPNSLYQPQPSPYTLQQPATQNQQQSAIIWVQGEAGAKSYMLAPNTTIPLWDSESETIYLKSTDASGMPSIKVIRYTIEQPQAQSNQLQPQQFDLKDYVRRDEFNDYMKQFTEQIKEAFNNGKSNISTANATKAESAESAKPADESI